MRLWHEKLLPYLPRAQLLGQHRECCALRGLSWGKKHAVVDYVFTYPMEYLYVYHLRVMAEMHKRGYTVEDAWLQPAYRGRRALPAVIESSLIDTLLLRSPVYDEHDDIYWTACVENLRKKGIQLVFDINNSEGKGEMMDESNGYHQSCSNTGKL